MSNNLDPHPPVQETPTDVPQTPTSQGNQRLLIMMGVMGILILTFYGIIRILVWPELSERFSESPKLETTKPPAKSSVRPASQDGTSSDLGNTSPSRQETATSRAERDQRAVNWSRLVGAYSEAKQTKRKLEDLKEATQTWQTTVGGLQSNEVGKKLAADTERLEEYRALKNQDRFTNQQLMQWEEQIASCLEPLDLAYQAKDKEYIPDNSLISLLSDLSGQIKDASQQMVLDQLSLDAILAQVESREPAEKTLAEAIIKQTQKMAEKRNQTIAAAQKKAEETYTKRLAELAVEQVKLKRQAQVEKQEHENAMLRLKSAQEAENQKREQAKKMALHRFEQEYPKVKSLLIAFTTKDYSQVGTFKQRMYVKSAEKTAASLAAIKGLGALDDDLDGLNMMYRLGGQRAMGSYVCKRPLGGLPSYRGDNFSSAAETERIKRAQQFLRDYGEIMVEQGLLSP